jgi:membrane protein involved in colicin uptake
MPAVRQSQRNRQLVEPYQAAGPPTLTIRQQRRRNARSSRQRKTKKEIVNEEVRKVTFSRQVIFFLIYIYFIQ